MKSVKPGRGPSGMSFIGSVFAIIFGVFWTITASTITQGAGVFGLIFPLFGVLFIGMGIVNAVYHYKNATGKNRFSAFDITDSGEEGDPTDQWIQQERDSERKAMESEGRDQTRPASTSVRFCPYCGAAADKDFQYCVKCGRELPR